MALLEQTATKVNATITTIVAPNPTIVHPSYSFNAQSSPSNRQGVQKQAVENFNWS